MTIDADWRIYAITFPVYHEQKVKVGVPMTARGDVGTIGWERFNEYPPSFHVFMSPEGAAHAMTDHLAIYGVEGRVMPVMVRDMVADGYQHGRRVQAFRELLIPKDWRSNLY